MAYCTYKPSYQDHCENEVSPPGTYCNEHKFISCAYHEKRINEDDSYSMIKCQEKAIGECSNFRGSFICGMPLCEKHLEEHKASHAFS